MLEEADSACHHPFFFLLPQAFLVCIELSLPYGLTPSFLDIRVFVSRTIFRSFTSGINLIWVLLRALSW